MKLKLKDKQHETGDVWSFYFEPIEAVAWQAGQSIRLELPRSTWGVAERRFTIASAPHEKHLQITTRLSDSEFKQLLDNLKPGQEIDGYNIEGSFTLEPTGRPVLFIAGGVGITPFRSLTLEALNINALHDVILLHRGQDTPAIFQTEFQQLSDKRKGFSYHQLESRINLQLLEHIVADWKERTVYVCGTLPMVEELTAFFIKNGLNNNQIKRDIFTGNIS